MSEALDELETLDDVGCTREAAREAWEEVFDTTFFGDQPDESSVKQSASSAFVVTSSKTAQRDDGGARFG